MKKLFFWASTFLLLLFAVSCEEKDPNGPSGGGDANKPTPEKPSPENPNKPDEISPETSLVEGLLFTEAAYEIYPDIEFDLRKEVLVFPEEVKDKATIHFYSSDSEIVQVSKDGKVIGKKVGEAVVLAKANGHEVNCKLNVKEPTIIEFLSLNYTEKEILSEDTFQLRASFTPNDPTYSELEWSSSNAEVASVDENGLVTTHKDGDAVITVTHKAANEYDKEVGATCSLKVLPVILESIDLNYTSFKLISNGATLQLKATVAPENATYSDLEWTSSNPSVATVSATGLVTPKSNGGNTTITCKHKAANEFDKELSVTCIVQVIDASSFSYTTQSINGVIFEMAYVEGGTFQMGANAEQSYDADSDEKPVHTVSLSSFYLSKTEVTQAQYQAVMGENPSYFKGDNLPVEGVCWYDSKAFCEKLSQLTGKNYVLPTEAQWEYAARGGKYHEGTKYSGSNTVDEVAWYGDNSNDQTHPVATKAPNALGLYDMSGNVYEWCADWYGEYSAAAQTNPTGPETGGDRVIRGGGWDSGARHDRVSYRCEDVPGIVGFFYYGFRVALLP